MVGKLPQFKLGGEGKEPEVLIGGGLTQCATPLPEADDPWVHRAERMRCRTCMWYVAKPASGPQPLEPKPEVGRCRRHAPTLGGYPVVFPSDWCGDHKLSEAL
jgi:hypothetical protein